MSRSRKKSNFHGITTSDSEKYNKQTYHRGQMDRINEECKIEDVLS